MKAEDIKRIWESSYIDKEDESLKDQVIRFARACEQHGVERAKSGVRIERSDPYDPPHRDVYADWSALDAEIAKENEGG